MSVAGERLPRLRQGGRPAFTIPMADGTTRQISIGGQLTGLQVYVDDGTTIPLERKLQPLGARPGRPADRPPRRGRAEPADSAGLIAIGANLRLVRMPWPPAVRLVALIVSLLVALAASVVLANLVSRFPVAP